MSWQYGIAVNLDVKQYFNSVIQLKHEADSLTTGPVIVLIMLTLSLTMLTLLFPVQV